MEDRKSENQCGRQFLNAVDREPVETRVLNPTASEASYKPKQRSYRNVLKPFWPNKNWAETVLDRNNQEPYDLNKVGYCYRFAIQSQL